MLAKAIREMAGREVLCGGTAGPLHGDDMVKAVWGGGTGRACCTKHGEGRVHHPDHCAVATPRCQCSRQGKDDEKAGESKY